MNEIVYKSAKGNPITDSLLVSAKFEKDHKNVIQAINNLLMTADNSAVRKMFAETTYTNKQNKRQPAFIMNRDGFSLLVMGFTGEKALNFKIDFIEAFNKMEQSLKLQLHPAVPSSFAEALELAAHQAREIEAKDKLIAIQAPKADFADRVIDSENMVDIGQAAKLLKLSFGRNIFFKRLREDGVLFIGRNEPKQEYIERGYFELRQHLQPRPNLPDLSVTKVLVTQKGLFWLSKKYGASFIEGLPKLNLL